eukprot:TRINITY_DN7364_c1_g2_i1.p1 TRINITY_DN7364_c1_g2~~TRINITY_DN7364_c1_g2_i1.p1  ORF type:complete len:556 (-),score=102.33 TRINITY_DN7364_c1_g2_i1:173-1840(-)
MIDYEEGKWGPLFSLKGSVLMKAAKWAVPFAFLTAGIGVVIRAVDGGWQPYFQNMGIADRLRDFSFILGFLIVFRSQQAYSRWWEGGTLLQQLRGEWFNAFSSLLAFSNTDPRMQYEVQRFQHQLVRMMSMLYANALKQVSAMTDNAFELIEIDGFDQDSLEFMMESHDACEIVLQWVQRLIVEANSKDVIKIAPPILSRVYNQLGNGIVRLNNARKIREFPIPFPLAQMVAIMLLVHSFVTAFVCAVSVDSPALASVFCFSVVLAFWSIHYIAVELEQPFGDDPNDLPLHDMMTEFHFDQDFHTKLSTARTDLEAYVTSLVASGKGQKRVKKPMDPVKPPDGAPSSGIMLSRGDGFNPGSGGGGDDVDNCFDGSADQGRADEGNCDDKAYRDSQLGEPNTGEPRGGNGVAAGHEPTLPTVMEFEPVPKMWGKDSSAAISAQQELPMAGAIDLEAVSLEARRPYAKALASSVDGGVINYATDALLHDTDKSRVAAEPSLLGAATERKAEMKAGQRAPFVRNQAYGGMFGECIPCQSLSSTMKGGINGSSSGGSLL